MLSTSSLDYLSSSLIIGAGSSSSSSFEVFVFFNTFESVYSSLSISASSFNSLLSLDLVKG